MKIIRLDDIEGKDISQYDSDFIMRKIVMTKQPSHVGILDLKEKGLVGYHNAIVPQILIILEGEGWVRTGHEPKVKVTKWDVVLWETGEGHETTTDEGMRAIVIEGEGIDVQSF